MHIEQVLQTYMGNTFYWQKNGRRNVIRHIKGQLTSPLHQVARPLMHTYLVCNSNRLQLGHCVITARKTVQNIRAKALRLEFIPRIEYLIGQ